MVRRLHQLVYVTVNGHHKIMLSTTHPGMDDVPYIYEYDMVRDPFGHTEARDRSEANRIRIRRFLIQTVYYKTPRLFTQNG